MDKKIILITGATGGIGKYTAISLARMGATVVITGRNKVSGENSVTEIREISRNPNVYLILADISSITGIAELVKQFKSKFDQLDVLINNAGSAASERILSTDGIEMNFAVNVLAPYLLTTQLMDLLKMSSTGRVITLMGGDIPKKLELNNLQAEKSFDGLNYYSQSKMAMMTMMYEYSQRLKGTSVTVNICYPGQASTKMTQSVTSDMMPGVLKILFPLFKFFIRPDGGKSAEKASRSSVYLSTSIDLENKTGVYVDKDMKIRGLPKVVADNENRKYIWDYIITLTKDRI